MKTPWRLHSLLCATIGLTGCLATTPDTPALSPTLPTEWHATHLPGAVVSDSWLNDLDAPALKGLINEALSYNHSLQQAAFRMQATKARAEIANGSLLPTIEARLDGQRARMVSENKGIVSSSTKNAFGMDLTISWEADLWGRLAATSQAADANALASIADFQGARLSLAATVARNWFGVLESNQQIDLAQQALASYRASLEAIEERYRQGISSALDLRLARSDLAGAENQSAQRQREQDGLIKRLEILLGRYPAGLLRPEMKLPETTKPVPVGLPSELLQRRPDLVAAAYHLKSAGAHLQATKRSLFPSLRLTAKGGTSSLALADLLDWDRLIWNLVGGLTQPIFQGGRLRAEVALAKVEHKEAWATYAQAILQAFLEVESALGAEINFIAQINALKRAANEASMGVELALSQYRNGLVDIVTLLETQRRAYSAESSRLRLLRERLENRINLYLSLGGGFDMDHTRISDPFKTKEAKP